MILTKRELYNNDINSHGNRTGMSIRNLVIGYDWKNTQHMRNNIEGLLGWNCYYALGNIFTAVE